MRLLELINEQVDPAGRKLIDDTIRTMSQEGKDPGKYKIVGSDNLVTVIFLLGQSRSPAGSMKFAGSGRTHGEIEFDEKEQAAMKFASELVHRLGDFVAIEDYTISRNNPGYRESVNLFMVSDGFMGTEL